MTNMTNIYIFIYFTYIENTLTTYYDTKSPTDYKQEYKKKVLLIEKLDELKFY